MDVLSGFNGRRCLVTGASGFIGPALTEALSRTGAVVWAPRRHQLNLGNADQVDEQIGEFSPHFVFHLASDGVNQPVPKAQLWASNVDGTRNLVRALARLRDVPRVVLLGSCVEYAPKAGRIFETDALDPYSDYGRTKVEAAALARQEGAALPQAWVRLFNVYGPHDASQRLLPHVVRQCRQGLPVETTAGEQLRDFTHVDDVAEGLMRLALSLPARPFWDVYNLGSGEAMRLRDFIAEAAAALREQGLSPDIRFGAKPYRPGEPMEYLPDISKLRSRLGWSPGTPMGQGIRSAVASLLRT
jgi:nucleoside-diphosphate-sugar epimerase